MSISLSQREAVASRFLFGSSLAALLLLFIGVPVASAQFAYDPYAEGAAADAAPPSSYAPANGRSSSGMVTGAGAAANAPVANGLPGGAQTNFFGIGGAVAQVIDTGQDAVRFGKEIVQFRDQVKHARQQYDTMVGSLKQLKNINVNNLDGFLSHVDNVLASASNFGYSVSNSAGGLNDLEESFNAEFPTVGFTDEMMTNDRMKSVKGQMDRLQGKLSSLRSHAREIAEGQEDMSVFADQLQSADSPTKVAEVQASMQHYALNESKLTRRLMMQQMQSEAVNQAEGISQRRLQTARALRGASAVTDRNYSYAEEGENESADDIWGDYGDTDDDYTRGDDAPGTGADDGAEDGGDFWEDYQDRLEEIRERFGQEEEEGGSPGDAGGYDPGGDPPEATKPPQLKPQLPDDGELLPATNAGPTPTEGAETDWP